MGHARDRRRRPAHPARVVNAYVVVTDDGLVLVDTGLPRRHAAIERALAKAQRSVGEISTILLTHRHVDRKYYGPFRPRRNFFQSRRGPLERLSTSARYCSTSPSYSGGSIRRHLWQFAATATASLSVGT